MTLFFFQCTERKRANPLDPLNPDTGGKLSGISIASEFKNIIISWKPVRIKDLVGYQIYRKTTEEDSFRSRYLASADSTQFIDHNVRYGIRYSYQISVLTVDYESPLSDSISIIPGPTVIWATDAYNRRLIQISDDGIHEIRQIAVEGYPWDIKINSRNRTIWYSDVLWGVVYQLISDRWEVYRSLKGWWDPVAIAIDEARGTTWVADQTGKVIRINPGSSDRLMEIEDYRFQSPVALDVDNRTGKCWVVDAGSKRLFHISQDGRIVTEVAMTFNRPLSVTVNSTNGSGWIADGTRVLKLDSRGSLSISIETDFQQAYLVDVNDVTGDVWIADIDMLSYRCRLFKFNDQGNRLLQVDGFNFPRALAVNPDNNGCVVADTDNGRIVQLSSNGEIVSQLGNYYYLRGLFVEYSPL